MQDATSKEGRFPNRPSGAAVWRPPLLVKQHSIVRFLSSLCRARALS